MVEPFIGSIQYFAFDYAPKGYLQCAGQSLPVAQNQALYSLITNVFGGNTTNFNLPDYRGRAILGYGRSVSGQSVYNVGDKGGVESVVIPPAALPIHSHTVNPLQIGAVSTPGTASTPKGNYPAAVASAQLNYSTIAGSGTMAIATSVSSVGGAATPVMAPFAVLNCCIAVTGIYPSRP